MLQEHRAPKIPTSPVNALGFASGLCRQANQTRLRTPQGSSLDQAIRLAQRGDAAAFEHIYRLHSHRVYSLCLRMSRDPAEAEDLTQEAFLQLFRKIHTFRGESAFSSWLYRLTANVALMSFRKKKPTTDWLENPAETDDESGSTRHEIGFADLRLSGLFDRINLESAIEQLPEGYKAMFLLHDVYGYDHNAIAKMRGCSVGNSKSQLHKARKRLREELRGRDAGSE
jgi:RNA polymerase sigma-70 factor (ECF subfamily)